MPTYLDTMEIDLPGPSESIATPLPEEELMDYSVAGYSMADPRETDLEQELRDRIARQNDIIIRECMEWERRILKSACLSYFTAEDIHKDYHMPTLPYPLLK